MKAELQVCPGCGQELDLGDLRPGVPYECPHCATPVGDAADAARAAGRARSGARLGSSDRERPHRRIRCVHHEQAAAIRRCEICGQPLCAVCLVHRYVDHVKVEVCPCGGRVHRLTPEERGITPVRFHQTLSTAYSYPFQGQGSVMLFLGTLFLSVASLLFKIPILGWGFMALTAAYMAAFLTRIIFTTALGSDEAPEWPALGRLWSNLFLPFVLVSVAVALCGGPAGAWYYFYSSLDPVFLGLALVGGFFLPMALACIALTGSVLALNPLLWLATILKVPGEYLLACFMFFLAAGLKAAGEAIASQIPYAGPVVGTFLLLYFLMVEMRILGLTFRANRARIGWF